MVTKWTPSILSNLVQAIKDDECFAFIGAGISIGAGFPDWKQLTGHLAGLCEDLNRYKKEFVDELNRLVETDDLWWLDWLRRAHFSHYQSRLEDIFPTDASSYRPTRTHQCLLRLRFRGYITTNYDMCLERAANRKRESVVSYSHADVDLDALLNPNNRVIYHVHGKADNNPSLITTPLDYYGLYSQSNLTGRLTSLLSKYSALFVGYSFRDYEIRKILENLANAYRDESRWKNARSHFAILAKRPDDTSTGLREQLYAEVLKTQVVYYTAYPLEEPNQYGETEDHRELYELLLELEQAARFGVAQTFEQDQLASEDATGPMRVP